MANDKLQRWTDLLAALLRRRYAVSFEGLVQDVPGYAHDPDNKRERDAALRTFERDKDELRDFGVRIETEIGDGGQSAGYTLSRQGFYLPYLALFDGTRVAHPKHVDEYGYQNLPTLQFDADELTAIAQAARRVAALENPLLADDAAAALRKLRVDLPVDAATIPERLGIAPSGNAPTEELFATLTNAVLARKSVAFDYHSMASDSTTRRTVAPFGLFYLSHKWYLVASVAQDDAMPSLRNFRLDRMQQAVANKKAPATPDFEIPQTFRLSDHARSRHAWELGDADAIDAVVEFRARTGAVSPALQAGQSVEHHPNQRVFKVRRRDAFVRWLMSFAGAAVPVSPPELVADFHSTARATAARYTGGN